MSGRTGAVFATTGHPCPRIKKQCPDAPGPFLGCRVAPVCVYEETMSADTGAVITWDAPLKVGSAGLEPVQRLVVLGAKSTEPSDTRQPRACQHRGAGRT